ncbi:MAG: Lrp/AsnC family transcriptional regulator [Chloroflexota bacterium]
MANQLDDLDRKILDIMQGNGRISNAQLAERISLSPAATHKRLKRLEQEGYIEGYYAKINRRKLGYRMLCYIHISIKTHSRDELNKFREMLKEMPEVLACSFVTGEFDYVVKVAIRDEADLESFILNKITPVPGVSQVSTRLVVAEIKNGTTLPVHITQKD